MDLLGCAGFQLGAVDHHRDPLGNRKHGVHVVLDQDQGMLGGELLEEFDDLPGLVGAHAGKWFVKQQ
ncbi:MAG: hypothetical protein MAG794_00252 [Gammaproteobacteria bacterium]|nr:hypothetical protein [Gammaproteobacteria bacterium]